MLDPAADVQWWLSYLNPIQFLYTEALQGSLNMQVGSREFAWCICKMREYQSVVMEKRENERKIWCEAL